MSVILNLSAPGAAKFVNPFALSNRDESSLAFTTSSIISNPTLYDGLLLYGSNIIKDVDTSTKVPRIKYTPSFTPKAEPVVEAFSRDRVNMVSPAFKVVFP